MFKVLVADKLGQAGLDLLASAETVTYDLKPGLSKAALIDIMPDYDALIVRSGTRPDADIINAGVNLKVIGRAGIGVDNIDIPAATQRGIIVMNTPAANSIATAEHALNLMLATSRKTAHAHGSVKAGEWNRAAFKGQELHAKTLGIIGFGRIGRLVTARAQAFGMRVIAFDPYVSEQVGRDLNVTLVDLDDLFAGADYISLHTAATKETTGIINARSIAQMKDGVIIVNAARGKLIETQALFDGLNSGKIKAVGLDVYESEPPTDNPLIGHPAVTHVPHLGASTVEAQTAVATQMAQQIIDALTGSDIRNALNVPFPPGVGLADMRPYMNLATAMGKMSQALLNGEIKKIEITVSGKEVADAVRPIAAAFLMGAIVSDSEVNLINAPILAQQAGVEIEQTHAANGTDYPNLIVARSSNAGGELVIAGTLFGNCEPRIVQVDDFRLEARPEDTVLLIQNDDVPGVIGQVGTILAAYEINIAEWRMGRRPKNGEALSFINLDSEPEAVTLDALERIAAITKVRLLNF